MLIRNINNIALILSHKSPGIRKYAFISRYLLFSLHISTLFNIVLRHFTIFTLFSWSFVHFCLVFFRKHLYLIIFINFQNFLYFVLIFSEICILMFLFSFMGFGAFGVNGLFGYRGILFYIGFISEIFRVIKFLYVFSLE